ncbi:MAG: ABC transporter permease [Candidatus Kerfeldbacteria bacterium]
MWRRKFRTLLTIIGIAVGIFAFTVMGSMSLKLNKMIAGGKRYITGQITIMPKGTMEGSGAAMLPVDTLDKIAKVDGVDVVAAMVELPLKEMNLDDPSASFSMGPAPTIEAFDLNVPYKNRNWQEFNMKEGRMLEKGDGTDVMVLGISIATDNNKKVGDTMNIRGKDFRVIGVLERTMTGPDNYAMMDIQLAREMLIESNPFLKSLKQQADEATNISAAALAKLPEQTRQQIQNAKTFNIKDVTTMAAVSWKDGQDSETVANRIKDQYKKDVTVLSPVAMGKTIDKATAIFNAVVLGSALIALIVGGFSIINTMIMSISERTKEIGIKKSLGASRHSIAAEYTLEAGVIGIIGGLIGMGFGVFVATIINSKMKGDGAEIFLLAPSFLGEVLAFAFVLGIIAGIIPAVRAARMKAVDAIREL